MKANKIKKLKQKIKTWKVWFSKSMFGFHDFDDICVHSLATSYEPKPDAIIYGLDIYDALKRYLEKRPWAKDIWCSQTDRKTFARAVVLPNHGLHLKACSWNLNLPKHVEFWK